MTRTLRVLRQIVAPTGRHRPRPVGPVLTAPDPDEIRMPCHTTRCAHLTTRHDEVSEDQFKCRGCGNVTTGGA
ncbi:hypothetical protein [Streptomyces sp. NPDC005302]|uniref:hypothetical protein n=1 Tax=Streptomyces sp. NPDC005302 TaxID=3154675 RepID=UPI0033A2A604